MGANEKVQAALHPSTTPDETTYTPAGLVQVAKLMFGESWEAAHPSFHTEDWLYWRTAHALQVALARLEEVDVHDVELLRAEAKAEHRRRFTAETARDEYRAERDALAAVIEQAKADLNDMTRPWHHVFSRAMATLRGADTDAAFRETRAKAVEQAGEDITLGLAADWKRHGNVGIAVNAEAEASTWLGARANDIREGRA